MRSGITFSAIMILCVTAVAEVQTEFVYNDTDTPYNSWLMYGTTTTDWTKASIEIVLTEGTMSHEGGGGFFVPAADAYSFWDTGGVNPNFNPFYYSDWIEDPDYFSLTWWDLPDDGAGTWLLFILTITTDAMGTITGTNYDADTAATGVDFAFEIVNGQIIPEPATVVTLLLCASGLLRRRRKV